MYAYSFCFIHQVSKYIFYYDFNNSILKYNDNIINHTIINNTVQNRSIQIEFMNNIYEINFNIKTKTNIKIYNNNLLYNITILLSESLIGLNINFKLPNDKECTIKYNNIINPEKFYYLKNKGLTINNITGDIIIKFKIIYPTNIKDHKKCLIKKLLPYINHNLNNNNFEIINLESN